MSLHHLANHVASKGRNGDSTLVHMTKDEVAGLQALAKRNGTSLTINPHTGLPEAFGLKSLLPIAAGIALGPAGFGIASSAMGAGLMVGGATALATGSLKEGLVAGLGAYGGAGLAGTGAAAGATEAGTQTVAGEGSFAGSTTAQPVVTDAGTAAGSNLAPVTTNPVTTGTAQGTELGSFNESGQAASGFQPSQPAYTTMPDTSTMTPPPSGSNYVAPSTSGATTAPVDARTTYDPAFKASPYSGSTEASLKTPSTFERVAANAEANPKYIGAAAAPALAEDMQPKPYTPPERKVDADMGQRLGYESGYDNSIPGRTSAPTYTKISNEEAKKLYGFAEGGDVQFPYGEPVIRMADGGTAGDYSGYGAGGIQGDYSGYGSGGIQGNYSGYDAPVAGVAALPAARASSVTAPANGMVYDPVSRTFIGSSLSDDTVYKGGGEYGLSEAAQKALAETAIQAVVDSYGGGAAQGGLMQSYAEGGNIQFSGDPSKSGGLLGELMAKLKAQGAFSGEMQSGDTGTGYTYDAQTKQYTPNMASGGGISTLGSYSDGGRLLKGPGDGMSDNIPATIGRKQPARLADGEFVIPADVVSHLGNGSTDAGAKQLYSMMDKIRAARTGRKAQGKQINPSKYMPV